MILMVPLQLIPHLSYETLVQAFKKEKNARVTRNIQIILQGYQTNYYPNVREIAQLLHLSKTDVRKWIHKWNQYGLQGLQLKKHKGRAPLLTPQEQTHVIEGVCKHPREIGFEFSTWTLKMIAKYILEQFGKHISLSSISRMLKRNNIVQLVPRTRPAKGDAKKNKSLNKN